MSIYVQNFSTRFTLDAKGLRVNMRITKIMVSRVDLQRLKDSGKSPCSVCRKVVGSNCIYCTGCLHRVLRKCSGIIDNLKLTLITTVADAKVLLVQLMGDLITNGYLCKIKNWVLLTHFVTLEIRSVLEVIVIFIYVNKLYIHTYMCGASFRNPCQYYLHRLFYILHVVKYTAYIFTLSSCMPMIVGHQMSATC